MELVFLFGIVLLYIAVGTLDIFEILKLLMLSYNVNHLILFSLFFILISFFFKIGLFPFHFYILDLYKTAPLYAIVIFSTIPKFVYFYFISFFIKIFIDLQFYIVYDVFLLKTFYLFFFSLLLFSFFFITLKIINEFSFLGILAYSGISTYTLAILPFFGFEVFFSTIVC